eukprot:54791-Prymnesium_polylepis.1
MLGCEPRPRRRRRGRSRHKGTMRATAGRRFCRTSTSDVTARFSRYRIRFTGVGRGPLESSGVMQLYTHR